MYLTHVGDGRPFWFVRGTNQLDDDVAQSRPRLHGARGLTDHPQNWRYDLESVVAGELDGVAYFSDDGLAG